MGRDIIRWFGGKIKKSFQTDGIANILLEAGPIQAGPCDGGCLVVAKALRRIIPGGRIVTIEGLLPDGTWQAEHYGLMLGTAVIDGDGYARSRSEWRRRFVQLEDLGRQCRVVDGESEAGMIPDDPPSEKKLAAALRRYLEA